VDGFTCVHLTFFFSSRRRHTRFSRDWSSDVCSSDLVPAPLEEDLRREAMESALAAHRALGCRGVSRADFRFDDREEAGEEGGLYLLEVNTQPGMTPLSLVPEQAAYCGISFPDLVEWIAERAQCD